MQPRLYTSAFLAFYLVFCSTSSLANITDYKFYTNQVYDAQRSPAFPIANNLFTLSYFNNPYRANLTQYNLLDGGYIQLFYVGGICHDGQVGINHYDAKGHFLETVQSTGHIYGLTNQGFLHDNDNNIGTFISTQYVLNNSSLSYIPTTGPSPESCSTLESYKPSQTHKRFFFNFKQGLFPITSSSPAKINSISENQLSQIQQQQQAANEILGNQQRLIADYAQQIQQLTAQLADANQVQKQQAYHIEVLEKKLDQYMQLIFEHCSTTEVQSTKNPDDVKR
ncbi:MAG TPA: hypothetical protein VHE99_10010 [Gammaproteobacteria bacterium]|nr:hypothetical protein [Gammaproteobacteria bacterium]